MRFAGLLLFSASELVMIPYFSQRSSQVVLFKCIERHNLLAGETVRRRRGDRYPFLANTA